MTDRLQYFLGIVSLPIILGVILFFFVFIAVFGTISIRRDNARRLRAVNQNRFSYS